jgi:predicted amidohydrolase
VLALAGADLIVLPTNWPTQGERAARLLTPARALENRVYFAAVNRVGEERGYRFIGLSQLVDCSGDLLAFADHADESILYAEINPARARQKKIVNIPGEYEVDRVHDRRPDLYGPLIQGG